MARRSDVLAAILVLVVGCLACGGEPSATDVPQATPEAAHPAVNLPPGEGVAEVPGGEPLEVVVTAAGEWWFRGEKVDAERANALLDEVAPERVLFHLHGISLQPVVIRADAAADWQPVLGTLYWCLTNALPNVYLAVSESGGERYLPLSMPWLAGESTVIPPADYGATGPILQVALADGKAVVRTVGGSRVMKSSGFGAMVDTEPAPGFPPTALTAPDLVEKLRVLAEPEQRMVGELVDPPLAHLGAGPGVLYGDVVRLFVACRRAGLGGAMPYYGELYSLGSSLSLRFGGGALGSRPSVPSTVRRGIRLPESALPSGPAPPHPALGIVLLGDEIRATGGWKINLRQLKDHLFKRAERWRDHDREGLPSETAVLITADAGLPWQRVAGVLQVCADPAIRIHRVYWSVQVPGGEPGEESQVAAFLPVGGNRRGHDPDEGRPIAGIQVDPGEDEGEAGPLLRCGRQTFPNAEALRAAVATWRAKAPGLVVQLEGAADATFGDVVRAFEAVRTAGVEVVRFAVR